jgi:hypothetical protein
MDIHRPGDDLRLAGKAWEQNTRRKREQKPAQGIYVSERDHFFILEWYALQLLGALKAVLCNDCYIHYSKHTISS